MIRNVILDLDGPILEGKHRHYRCYQEILRRKGYEPIGLKDYWRLKRERTGAKQILALSGAEAFYDEFQRLWLEEIELPGHLAADRLQSDALAKLRLWRDQQLRMILVTLRRHPDRLVEQLVRLKIYDLFDHVIVCEHQGGGAGKASRLKEVISPVSPAESLWVGDSEVDVAAARDFGCRIWAVACGVRSRPYLASLTPDFLSDGLASVDLKTAAGA